MTTLEKEKLSQFIETLNSVQKESVLSDATTLQILAGPGSGKTRGNADNNNNKRKDNKI